MCVLLQGHSDGSWSVALPAEEVPPELPEPCLGMPSRLGSIIMPCAASSRFRSRVIDAGGWMAPCICNLVVAEANFIVLTSWTAHGAGINFARDGMVRKDWLALVAVHSDAWLMSVAFYYGAKLDASGR